MPRDGDLAGGVVTLSERTLRTFLILVLLTPTAAAQFGDLPPVDPPENDNPAPLADLAVYSIGIDPEDPDYEHPIRFCAEFVNYGNGDPSPFSAALLLDDEEIASRHYTQLAREGDRLCTSLIVEAGRHRFDAIVDYDNEVPENSEDNNRRSIVFIVGEPRRPDLVVTLFLNPDPPRRGETASFTARVKNVGSESSNATTVAFTHNGVPLVTRALPQLPPGHTHLAAATLDADRLSGGAHAVDVTVDPDQKVVELNEANNAARRNFSMPRIPAVDVAVIDLNWSEPVRDTRVANFTARVRNIGDLDAGTFVVRFFLDNRTIIGSPRLGGLGAGNETNVTIEWAARSPGVHAVSAVIDPTRELQEASRSNNELHKRIRILPETDVPPAPDLIVDRVLVLPREPRPNEPLNVTAVIRNAGVVRSGPFDVVFMLNGTRIATSRFTSLSPGGVLASTATWTGGAGEHLLIVSADPDYRVNETDDSNNDKETILRVGGGGGGGRPPPAGHSTAPPSNRTAPPSTGNATAPPAGLPAAPEGRALLEIASIGYIPRRDSEGNLDPVFAIQLFNRGDAPAAPFAVNVYVDNRLVGALPRGGLAPAREMSLTWGRGNDPTFEPPAPGEHTLRVEVVEAGKSSAIAQAQSKFSVEEPPASFGAPAPGAALAAIALVLVAAARRRR